MRGASYGLRQSLDTVGALTGPLIATLLMLASGGSFRLVFWAALVPALASVAVLIRFVHEPSGAAAPVARPRIRWWELRAFPKTFWYVVAVGAVFTMARFSEAFLVLRAGDLGLASDYVPLVMVAMNAAYAASAYPAGKLSDRMDRRFVLAAGALVLVIADVVLAGANGIAGLIAGVMLWGLHIGLSQGLLAALVADAAPAERRGSAFGLFNLASGAMLLAASVVAGELWDRVGAPATFYAGAAFAGIAFIGLAYGLWNRQERGIRAQLTRAAVDSRKGLP